MNALTCPLTDLAGALRDLDDEEGGCCLHVTVTDFNVDDDSIRFCIDYAVQRGHQTCAELGRAFLARVPEEHREAFLGVRVEYDDRGGGLVHAITVPWRG